RLAEVLTTDPFPTLRVGSVANEDRRCFDLVKRPRRVRERLGHRVLLTEPHPQPSQQSVTRLPRRPNLSFGLAQRLAVHRFTEYTGTYQSVRPRGSVERKRRVVEHTTQVVEVGQFAV